MSKAFHHGRYTKSYQVLRDMISRGFVRMIDDETVEITTIGLHFMKKFEKETV